jgi:hypothetical protein
MTVSNKALVIAGLLSTRAVSPFAKAGVATPRIDQRQENQEQRIEQGIDYGRLTEHEANKLEAQQNRIDNAEARAKADGVVTRGERTRLKARQNAASRNIYRKKHNARHP